jgi:rhomboid protease GluP
VSIEVKGALGVDTLTFEDFERRVRQGEFDGETLVRMDVLTARDFRRLGELEIYQTLADPEDLAWSKRLRHGAPLMTALLVGLQIRIYLWSKAPGSADWLVDHATNWAPAVLEGGEVWRLLSYGFLHLGFTHLALNLLFLVYAGWNLERAMGRRNLLVVYLFAVVVGGLLSLAMSPGRPSLGASGGDFGLIAASVVFGWKHEDRLPAFARKYFGWAILPYLVYPLCLGLLSTSVDNWGHLGGLIGGAAMATWLQPDAFTRFRRANQQVRVGAFVASLLGAAALYWGGARLVHLRPVVSDTGLVAQVPVAWREGWALTEDRGWVSPTDQATLVASTKTYTRPLAPEEAVAALVEQLEARAEDVVLVEEQPLEVAGQPAHRVSLAFRLAGEDQSMELLVVTRGASVYRVHLNAPSDQAWRYRKLADRMFRGLELQQPPALLEARTKVTNNPRSWKSNLHLARQEALAGNAEASWEAYRKAYRYASERRAEIAVGILDLYADYGTGPTLELIEGYVEAHGDDPQVVAAAADALDRAGQSERAVALLQDAWAERPGDFALKRALRARGLPLYEAPGELDP